MAEAGEKSGGATSLENELSCPVCLCLYKDPVMLSCGHNFCNQCIQNVLDKQRQFPASCPMCKIPLGPKVELQKNFQLRSIVETFLAANSKGQQEDGSKERKKVTVLCDFCLDKSQPAVKTCLMCDASLCQAHLGKHNATASQQDHVVVEVGTGSVAERRCQEHGKLLECYCRDEGLYICLLCCIVGQHKGHNVITLKEAHEEQLAELSGMVTWLQERENALATALEGLLKNEQQLKTNIKTVISQTESLFEQLKTDIIKEKTRILQEIESIERKNLTGIPEMKGEIQKLRGEAAELLQSLQKMKEQPDVLRFFKEFKLIKDRIYSQDFSVNMMDMEVLGMDQAWIGSYKRLAQDFISDMKTLLREVQCDVTYQVNEYSGHSNPQKPSIQAMQSGSAEGPRQAGQLGRVQRHEIEHIQVPGAAHWPQSHVVLQAGVRVAGVRPGQNSLFGVLYNKHQ
ncbi:E3 ubiquitin/ISG15 ligase TRIM25-like [Melanerpes formicivorus]|uniref:E3 ubiquitin/ISG15 ligase TRIM25-like n=1 Tax=Melanerpes formicivorus TaxID=211600 RepID=UPI00358E9956